jgi:hypothetical protein
MLSAFSDEHATLLRPIAESLRLNDSVLPMPFTDSTLLVGDTLWCFRLSVPLPVGFCASLHEDSEHVDE